MKLTRKDHPERIRRFAHLGKVWLGPRCGARTAGVRPACSRSEGHRGPHAAHTLLGRVVAVWESDAVIEASPESRRAAREARSGLTERHRDGFVVEWAGRLRRVLSSPEELFLLILFLAFVVFAFDWILLILG